MSYKRIAAYRFDNLADLRESVIAVKDDGHTMGHRSEEILCSHGPMLLNLIEETLSDGSKVYNFGLAVMTKDQIKRDAE